jgi:hypothetical protein
MRHTISPKDEGFPSKERPLLGRLENMSLRQRELYLYGYLFFN